MWKKKGKGLAYHGMYLRDVKGERVFVLVGVRSNKSVHNVTFESHQAAKSLGWVKVS
jgi:hypothetical protein